MARNDRDMKLTRAEIETAFSVSTWAEAYPPVLSIEQVARLLQVPEATVYDWSSRGLLRGCARRMGKYLRFFRDRLITKVFNEGL
jgi:hypothetical protein